MMSYHRKTKESGFTLIELLTVIIIIGILAAVAIPVFSSQRGRANDAQTLSDVRNVVTAAETFLADRTNTVANISKDTIKPDFSGGVSTYWDIKGNTSSGGYCIAAYNPKGKDYNSLTNVLTYDSTGGGLKKSTGSCVGNLPTPTNTASTGSVAAAYSAAVLQDAPVSFYKLDDATAASAANAGSAASQATYYNVTSSNDSPFADGSKSAFFNGTTSYVALPGTYGGGQTYTIEAWVKTASTTGNFQAVVEPSSTQFIHLQLYPTGNNVVYTNNGQSFLPIVTDSPGTWRHVAITTSSGYQAVYVNGVLVGSDSLSYGAVTSVSDLMIGRGHNNTRYFNGNIAGVAIYNKALTAAQVKAHYDARG